MSIRNPIIGKLDKAIEIIRACLHEIPGHELKVDLKGSTLLKENGDLVESWPTAYESRKLVAFMNNHKSKA